MEIEQLNLDYLLDEINAFRDLPDPDWRGEIIDWMKSSLPTSSSSSEEVQAIAEAHRLLWFFLFTSVGKRSISIGLENPVTVCNYEELAAYIATDKEIAEEYMETVMELYQQEHPRAGYAGEYNPDAIVTPHAIRFTEEMVQSAHEKAAIKKPQFTHSLRNGTAQFAGFISEEAVEAYFEDRNTLISFDSTNEDRWNHDLVIDSSEGPLRIEIKSKQRLRPPKPNYDVSIGEHSGHQKPDLFIFTSLEYSDRMGDEYIGLKNIWLLGAITPDLFYASAKFIRKGDIDPTNGWKAGANVYNLPISKLSWMY